MFGGAAVATLIGMFMAWLSFRHALPPLSFALVTIALAMMGYLAISSIDVLGASQDYSAGARYGGDLPVQKRRHYYVVILVHVVGAVVLSSRLYHTKIGLYLRALRDNRRRSRHRRTGAEVQTLAMGLARR
jgi:ABC-type branched-subunit amino acid transport system permease subunit